MIFTEKDHSYRNDVGEKYTSITTLLGMYKPKKDWDKIAQNYADKGLEHVIKGFANNWEISKEQAYEKWGKEFDGTGNFIKKVWKDKSTRALEAGSFYHNWKEILDSQKEQVDYNPIKNGEKHSVDLTTLKSDFTYLELMCFSHFFKLCGQADKIIFSKDKKFIVRDFKTSKTIDFEQKSFYDVVKKKQIKERYISPISHLTTNNWNTYQLQLSCYAYLLESYGYICEGLWIDHVKWKYATKAKKGELIIGEEPDLDRVKIYIGTDSYKANYLKKEVAAIFNDFRNKNVFEVTW